MSRIEDRAAAIAQAKQIVSGPYLVLDTETTGLSGTSEIVDIGIVDHQGQVLLDSLVRPLHPIPRDATAIHGISDAMVAEAPTWAELWPEVERVLRGGNLGIYNEEFDAKMIRISCMLNGIGWLQPYQDSFCIMKLYSQFYGDWNDYFGEYRWQRLEFAGRQFGIELQNTHRALDDALLSREVLLSLAAIKG